jgi:hypothetical protein
MENNLKIQAINYEHEFFLRSAARSASVTEQPSTPIAAKVDIPFSYRTFADQSNEEGNDDSDTPVASLEPSMNEVHAASGDDSEGKGFTSRLSSPSVQPRFSMPFPPTPASIPPLAAATAAFNALAGRGRGPHTIDSAAEVAAIVAAKRKLKAFLPGYPLASENQVAAVLNKAVMHVNTSVPAAAAPNGPVYPAIVKQHSDNRSTGENLNSIVFGAVESNITATTTAAAPTPLGSWVFFEQDMEDQMFMSLDPVLVDVDLSLMPDGRMW